jgi:hypothetical protein
MSPQYGHGRWYWGGGTVSVLFPHKTFEFDSGSLYRDGRCSQHDQGEMLVSKNVKIPKNTYALIVAARRTKAETRDYILGHIKDRRFLTVYRSQNGWFAISIGFLKRNQKYILNQWKRSGKIPQDSYLTKGKKFVSEVYIDLNSERKSSRRNVSQDRALKCLIKTWGPDVCSHQFNIFAKKELGGEVTDIINSPACTAMISKAMNEPATDNDIAVATVTGVLDDAGHAGLNSDIGILNVLGAFSYLYSFSIKLDLYNDCINY